jgi:hypothetical protein
MIEQPKKGESQTATTREQDTPVQEIVAQYVNALSAAQEIPVHLKTDLCFELDGTYSPNFSSVDQKRRTLNLLETTYGDRMRALGSAIMEYQKCSGKEGFNYLDYRLAAPDNSAVVNLTNTTSYLVNLLENLSKLEEPGIEILQATLAVFELWQFQCHALEESNNVAEQEAQNAYDKLVNSYDRGQVEEDEDLDDEYLDDEYTGPFEDQDDEIDPPQEEVEDVANWDPGRPTWT